METKIKTMTESQAVELFKQGRQVMLVEYRNSRVDNIEWADKVTRVRKSADLCKHTVEAGPLSFPVNERMPEGWDANRARAEFAEGKLPFKKGTLCVLEFRTFKTEKGAISAEGTLSLLVK